jgi:phosphatidylinositol alpha-1,6-mannosyltransferase
MRSLWITNDLPPRAGGIEQFVGNLLDRTWPDQALVVGPAHDDGEAHDAGVPWRVRRLDGGVWPTPSVLAAVRAAAATHRPDVVVLGASWPLGELAPALATSPAVPVVAISHGLEAGLAGVGAGRLVGRTTRALAALTTISDFTEQRLAPWTHCPIRRVPPGVDVDRFHPAVGGRDQRLAWGVPPDAPLVGCVSRLVRRKGQDRLLDAWPALHARHPDAWLALVGTGPLEDELRARAAALRNVVVTGAAAWEDLPAVHAAFDVFAMPCRTRLLGTDVEGLGIVYLEAQASGVPVVAGDSGGAPETIQPGRTGIVVDGRSPGPLVAAVDGLLGDPVRRAAWGAAGRAHAVARWSWDAVAARFHDVLAEATAGAL